MYARWSSDEPRREVRVSVPGSIGHLPRLIRVKWKTEKECVSFRGTQRQCGIRTHTLRHGFDFWFSLLKDRTILLSFLLLPTLPTLAWLFFLPFLYIPARPSRSWRGRSIISNPPGCNGSSGSCEEDSLFMFWDKVLNALDDGQGGSWVWGGHG